MVGVYGVSVITVFIAAIMGIWFASRSPSLIWKRNATVVVMLTIIAGGMLKIVEWTSPIGKPIRVALLQGNIAQDEKWSPEAAQATIDQYMQMIMASKAQLIVTPETALPVISSQLDASVIAALDAKAKQNGGNLIIGMVEDKAQSKEKTDDYFNSAISEIGRAHV